jgi:hypothetical protein
VSGLLEAVLWGWALLLTLFWAGLAAGVPGWGRGYALARASAPAGAGPVRVCVPARDEAANIAACVRALRAWAHPGLEIIVVDDRSGDGTGELARAAAEGDARVVVREGSEPPAGWSGKAWACTRAAEGFGGRWLVFVDADVIVDPGLLDALLAVAVSEGRAMVSVFGTWTLGTFWERAAIPAIGWFIRGSVDLRAANDPAGAPAFANGQCILVAAGPYAALGGHGAVRGDVLDDVRLAEAFRSAGHPRALRVAPWGFSVRLYRSLEEIYRGYAKNLYECMGRRPAVGAAAVAFVLLTTFSPVAVVAAGVGGGAPALAVLGAVVLALQVWFRWRVERRDGRSGAMAWAHLPGNAVLLAALLRSVLGPRVAWKGRVFTGGQAAR